MNSKVQPIMQYVALYSIISSLLATRLTVCDTLIPFLLLTFRKPSELLRWKSEPGQPMPIWMSGWRSATTLTKQFKIHDSTKCFFFYLSLFSLLHPLFNRVPRTPNPSPTNQRRRSRRAFFDLIRVEATILVTKLSEIQTHKETKEEVKSFFR